MNLVETITNSRPTSAIERVLPSKIRSPLDEHRSSLPLMTDSEDVADRLALHELVNRHGHLVDHGDFAAMAQVFTTDVVYDVSALGGGRLIGLQAVEDAARTLGEGNPVGHHVTNVVVTELHDASARVLSKGLGVRTDGSVGSVVYDDEATRTDAGWRIRRRVVRPRRTPLRR